MRSALSSLPRLRRRLPRAAASPGLDFISKKSSPDEFGTLNKERALREIEDLPEEEGDKKVVEYLDGVEHKIRLRPGQYASLIKGYLKSKNLTAALDVLETKMLEKEKARPDKYIYSLLISACGEYGYTKKAFQLFNQMKKRGIRPTGGIYTSLFNACANSPWPEDGLRRGKDLKELMLEKGWEMNEINAHAMIKAFGRCGDIKLAFSIVDEMKKKQLKISTVTINFLLQASASDVKSGFKYALLVWRKMIELKIKPDLFTFNLMLRTTRDCHLGDPSEIDDIQNLLPSKNFKELIRISKPTSEGLVENPSFKSKKLNDPILPPTQSNQLVTMERENSQLQVLDQACVNFLPIVPQVSSVVFVDKVKKPWHRLFMIGGVKGFLSTMNSTKVKPDIKTFSQLLDSIPHCKDIEENLFVEMKNCGIKIDIDFCNLLIKKRNLSFRFAEGKEVFDIIRKEGLVPNIMTYGVFALGCCNLKDAVTFIKDMKNAGLRPNAEILGSIIKRGCDSWDIPMIRYVMGVLEKQKVKPNNMLIKHLNTFCNVVEEQKQIKESGGKVNSVLNKEEFLKEYDKFLDVVNYFNTLEIEESEMIHPWKQFRKTKHEEDSSQC